MAVPSSCQMARIKIATVKNGDSVGGISFGRTRYIDSIRACNIYICVCVCYKENNSNRVSLFLNFIIKDSATHSGIATSHSLFFSFKHSFSFRFFKVCSST